MTPILNSALTTSPPFIASFWARSATVIASPIATSRMTGAVGRVNPVPVRAWRSEEHTSELQSLMRISYAVFCLKNTNKRSEQNPPRNRHSEHTKPQYQAEYNLTTYNPNTAQHSTTN